MVNQELPEENKNPDLVSQLEDESQKDFSKKSSKDNDSIINTNIANSTSAGTQSDSLKGVPFQLSVIHDTASPRSSGKNNLKSFGNTVFSKFSSQDSNYSLKNSNVRNIKSEMKKNLLFTIKEQETEEKHNHGNKKVFWMNNIVILDQEIQLFPKYLVYDNNDSDLLWKDKLILTAAGYEKGLRKVRDGYTFFGVNETYVKKYTLSNLF